MPKLLPYPTAKNSRRRKTSAAGIALNAEICQSGSSPDYKSAVYQLAIPAFTRYAVLRMSYFPTSDS